MFVHSSATSCVDVARHPSGSKRSSGTTSIRRRVASHRHHDETGSRPRRAPVAARLRSPVYVGMRNWHPFLGDTMKGMAADGVHRAIGLVLAAHRSYSSCAQYRQNVMDARADVVGAGLLDVPVIYTGDWHTHPKFVEANARHVRAAIERLPADLRSRRKWSSPRTVCPYRWPERGATTSRLWNRRDSLPMRPPRATGRSCSRAVAAGPRIRGWVRMSASTCARHALAACLPWSRADWIRVRSHRGALRPRP